MDLSFLLAGKIPYSDILAVMCTIIHIKSGKPGNHFYFRGERSDERLRNLSSAGQES